MTRERRHQLLELDPEEARGERARGPIAPGKRSLTSRLGPAGASARRMFPRKAAPDGARATAPHLARTGAGDAASSGASLAGSAAGGTVAPPIAGPLRVGAYVESGELVVQQLSEAQALIQHGGGQLDVQSPDGEPYTFFVEAAADGEGVQRVVRVVAHPSVQITVDPGPEDLLVCHQRRSEEPGELAPGAAAPRGVVAEWGDPTSAAGHVVSDSIHEATSNGATKLGIEGSTVLISAGGPETRYAYQVDPIWTGSDGTLRLVHIVATPGVMVQEETSTVAAPVTFGRRLVPRIIRVQDPALVPAPGEPFDPYGFTHSDRHQGAGFWGDGVTAHNGRAGTTIEHELSGARVRISATDPSVGVSFAYQIIDAPNGGQAEIRVLVGPGAHVAVTEPPPPERTELPFVGTGAAPGETFAQHGVELRLYQVEDTSLIPVPGAPIDIPATALPRSPDEHAFVETRKAQLASLAADIGVGTLPGIGDFIDVADGVGSALTGRDRYGQAARAGDILTKFAGALLPIVSARMLQGVKLAEGASDAAKLAARLGKSADELDILRAAIARTSGGSSRVNAAMRRRIEAAMLTGSPIDAKDLARLERTVTSKGLAIDAGQPLTWTGRAGNDPEFVAHARRWLDRADAGDVPSARRLGPMLDDEAARLAKQRFDRESGQLRAQWTLAGMSAERIEDKLRKLEDKYQRSYLRLVRRLGRERAAPLTDQLAAVAKGSPELAALKSKTGPYERLAESSKASILTASPTGFKKAEQLDSSARLARFGKPNPVTAEQQNRLFAGRWRLTEHNGMRAYKRDDLIDLARRDDRNKTNAQRMAEGQPPWGRDNKPMELHHLNQNDLGPVVEITKTFHTLHYKKLHINDSLSKRPPSMSVERVAKGRPGKPRWQRRMAKARPSRTQPNPKPANTQFQVKSGVDRSAFDNWKQSYWRERLEELRGRGTP